MVSIFMYIGEAAFVLAIIGFFINRVDEWQQTGKIMMVAGLIIGVLTLVPASMVQAIQTGLEQETRQGTGSEMAAPARPQ